MFSGNFIWLYGILFVINLIWKLITGAFNPPVTP
jgi:hypothetical protein